jgi:hypothetical protein
MIKRSNGVNVTVLVCPFTCRFNATGKSAFAWLLTQSTMVLTMVAKVLFNVIVNLTNMSI